MNALDREILTSIWLRCQWDFLVQNPQLADWLEGSVLEASDEVEDGKPVYRLLVADPGAAEWVNAHGFALRRSLSVEMKMPVLVKVVQADMTVQP